MSDPADESNQPQPDHTADDQAPVPEPLSDDEHDRMAELAEKERLNKAQQAELQALRERHEQAAAAPADLQPLDVKSQQRLQQLRSVALSRPMSPEEEAEQKELEARQFVSHPGPPPAPEGGDDYTFRASVAAFCEMTAQVVGSAVNMPGFGNMTGTAQQMRMLAAQIRMALPPPPKE